MENKIVKATGKDSEKIASIVSSSNRDVADLFSLDFNNAPNHPSFCTKEWITKDFEKGHRYFLYIENGKPAGCVAYEKADNRTAYMNRLAVLPGFRHIGIGRELVNFVIKYAADKGIAKIGIGTIAEHTKLNSWYLNIGFKETGIKKFDHLPFNVMFMEYNIDE